MVDGLIFSRGVETSNQWSFLKIGKPKNVWFITMNDLYRMIDPHFKKPPYHIEMALEITPTSAGLGTGKTLLQAVCLCFQVMGKEKNATLHDWAERSLPQLTVHRCQYQPG